MARGVADYLPRFAQKSSPVSRMKNLSEMAGFRSSTASSERSTTMTILGVAALTFAAVLGYYFGPEMARYIKMMRM